MVRVYLDEEKVLKALEEAGKKQEDLSVHVYIDGINIHNSQGCGSYYVTLGENLNHIRISKKVKEMLKSFSYKGTLRCYGDRLLGPYKHGSANAVLSKNKERVNDYEIHIYGPVLEDIQELLRRIEDGKIWPTNNEAWMKDQTSSPARRLIEIFREFWWTIFHN